MQRRHTGSREGWAILGRSQPTLRRAQADQTALTLLVAAPVDYANTPSFLIGARSLYERASRSSDIRFAVLADDLAWTEIQGSCPCYLPTGTCDSIIRVADQQTRKEGKQSTTRSAASRAPARWEDDTRSAADRRVLVSLASCASLPATGQEEEQQPAPGAVLVLPDPHLIASRDPMQLMQGFEDEDGYGTTRPVVLSGGGMSSRVRGSSMPVGAGAASAEVLLVHGQRWRLAGSDWRCPLNEGGQRDALTQTQGSVTEFFPSSIIVQPMDSVSVGLLREAEAGQGALRISSPGCPASVRQGSSMAPSPPVLLRLVDRIKPWEGLPVPGQRAPSSAGVELAVCPPGGDPNPLTVKQETLRLLECRYVARPGMESVEYERLQYVWYYRYFRDWFHPGPIRPSVPVGEVRSNPREPPRADGIRLTDLTVRMGASQGQTNYAPFTDKASVKHFARLAIGEGHSVDTLGVVFPEVAANFRPPVDGLSDFAFKASNLAGVNAILRDGKMIICQGYFINVAKELGLPGCKGQGLSGEIFDRVLSKVTKRRQGNGREKQYDHVRRSMILERLYEGGAIPADYKFFCSRGSVIYVQEVDGRFEQGKNKRGFYLPDWTFLPDVVEFEYPYPAKEASQPPSKLAEMVRIAQQLSEPFPFVRVDLFEVNGKVYVGEMTYTPRGAHAPVEPMALEAIGGRIVAHHLPQPVVPDGWDSGLGVPAGTVLTQEQVTQAMQPLTKHDPEAITTEQLKRLHKKRH